MQEDQVRASILSVMPSLIAVHRISIGVGTPQRVNDLLEDGALSVKHLKRIIVDASYIDQKKRGILDMKETQMPLVKLLTRSDLRERWEDEDMPMRMLFY